jgi:hypothetical protein
VFIAPTYCLELFTGKGYKKESWGASFWQEIIICLTNNDFNQGKFIT